MSIKATPRIQSAPERGRKGEPMQELDPRFAKVVALMRSTEHGGERDAAQQRAEAIALGCGRTYADALAEMDRAGGESAPDIFDMFRNWDDIMEAKEPGYKAARVAEKESKRQAWEKRCAWLVIEYGTLDAVLEPCSQEEILRRALGSLVVPGEAPHERWAQSIDGWAGSLYDMPVHIRKAVEGAIPMPTTLDEALNEYTYWDMRADDMSDALGFEDQSGGLDLVAQARADILRDLVRTGFRAVTVRDAYRRASFYQQWMSRDDEMRDAMFLDLKALAEAEAASR